VLHSFRVICEIRGSSTVHTRLKPQGQIINTPFCKTLPAAALCLIVLVSSGFSQIRRMTPPNTGCAIPYFVDSLAQFPPASPQKPDAVNHVYQVLDSLSRLQPEQLEALVERVEHAGEDTLYSLLKYWEKINFYDGPDFIRYYCLAGPETNSGYRSMPLNIVKTFRRLLERKLANRYTQELFIAYSDLIAELEIISVSLISSSSVTKEFYDQYSIQAKLVDILKGKGMHAFSTTEQNGERVPVVTFCYRTLQQGGDLSAGDHLIGFFELKGAAFLDISTLRMPVTAMVKERANPDQYSSEASQAGLL
jgi:hypothetical protein